MKKYLFAAALVLTPVMAFAVHPEGDYASDIRSEIRDDNRQLSEDREAGYTQAVHDDEKDLAEDKARLRDALAHPNRDVPPPPPRAHPRPHPDDVKHHDDSDAGDQVNAAPPVEHPDHDDWKQSADKINPDVPFNHAARVDNEIR